MPSDGVGFVCVEDELEHAHVYDVLAVVYALDAEQIVTNRDLNI